MASILGNGDTDFIAANLQRMLQAALRDALLAQLDEAVTDLRSQWKQDINTYVSNITVEAVQKMYDQMSMTEQLLVSIKTADGKVLTEKEKMK